MGRCHCVCDLRGQSIVEYAILLGIVTAAVLGMQVYAKRGIQAGLKMTADSLSPFAPNDADGEKAQVDGMRYDSGDRQTTVFASGMVLDRRSATRTALAKSVNTKTLLGGGVEKTIVSDSVANTGQLPDGPGVSVHAEVVVDVR